eukprot:scaffold10747_cov86-Skeletonema_dohrnii-CCMP3373.AAC.1
MKITVLMKMIKLVFRFPVMKITVLMKIKLVFLTENAEVLANTKNPGSQLRKKSNTICYHYVHDLCLQGRRDSTLLPA